MHILEKISEFVGKWMAVVVLAIAALSLFVPKSTLWIELSWVNYLLMVVMFGMGLTLKLSDFKLVFTRPKEITIGCAAQFIVMPALAFALSKIFGLDAALMADVVLVGTCPGGTSSNVITYLSKGDVALSVGMTSVNTLLAPVLTPAITYLLLRTTVNVDVMAMFLSIVKVVIVPIALGFVINKFFGKWTARAVKVLPLVLRLRFWPRQVAKILGTQNEGALHRNRHAELRTCDKPCSNCILVTCHGDRPRRHLLRMAQHLRRDTRKRLPPEGITPFCHARQPLVIASSLFDTPNSSLVIASFHFFICHCEFPFLSNPILHLSLRVPCKGTKQSPA